MIFEVKLMSQKLVVKNIRAFADAGNLKHTLSVNKKLLKMF